MVGVQQRHRVRDGVCVPNPVSVRLYGGYFFIMLTRFVSVCFASPNTIMAFFS